MRIRYIKETPQLIEAAPMVEKHPELRKGRWRELFEERMGVRPEKLFLEVGCGKGAFIRDMGRGNKQNAYIGLERLSTILCRTITYLDNDEDRNIMLVREDALNLGALFEDGELDGIYLNFSDPWPKERHKGRRLTSDRFLPVYSKVLKENGVLRFKTDNADLFAFSLESFSEEFERVKNEGKADLALKIRAYTTDLHREGEPLGEGNVMSEYEKMFSEAGKTINCLEADNVKPVKE